MKIGKYIFDRYGTKKNILALDQLKEVLIIYYYGEDCSNFEDELKRELIISEIKDCYGTNGHVFFSMNGSPPKGSALLQVDSYSGGWKGRLILFGNTKMSRPIYNVEIRRENGNTKST